MSSAPQTIAREFAILSRLIELERTSPIQQKEVKRAFYAGFTSCLTVYSELTVLSEDEAVGAMKALHTEARDFAQKILQGDA